jgi:hypothetical protein
MGLTHITFGISPPHNTVHMFGSWTNAVGEQLKRQLLSSASVFYWAIWLISRNYVVFDKSPIKSLLQVLYRATQFEKNDEIKR